MPQEIYTPHIHFRPYPIFDTSIPQVNSMQDTSAVMNSLTVFSRQLNATNELDTLMLNHQHVPGYTPTNFVLSEPVTRPSDATTTERWWHPNEDFHIDASYGLAIGTKFPWRRGTYWAAFVGFDAVDSDPQAPVISQLQFRSKRDKTSRFEHNAGRQRFQDFRCESALVNVVALWAERANFQTIYIQPGNKNKFYTGNVQHRERFRRRYDGTARWLGFKKDPVTGLHKLPLSPGQLH